MRINDLINESERLDEKPMGFLKKMGNKLASKVPGSIGQKAAGRLETGDEANNLKKEFMTWLGKTGDTPEPEIVLQFLKQKGYPTQGAEKAMNAPTTGQKIGQAVGAAGKAVKNVAKDAKSFTKDLKTAVADAPAEQDPKQGPQAGAQKPAQKPQQAPANVQKPAQNAPATAAPAPQAAQPAAAPPTKSQEQPVTAKAAPSKSTVKVSGQPRAKVRKGPAIQKASIDFAYAEALFEALTGAQLDKVFTAAVQDKARGGTPEKGATAAPGGLKGFMAGMKQGYKDEMDKEPGALAQVGKAFGAAAKTVGQGAAAARQGASIATQAGQDTAARIGQQAAQTRVGPGNDQSGPAAGNDTATTGAQGQASGATPQQAQQGTAGGATVPPNIAKQIKQLQPAQKKELLGMLG